MTKTTILIIILLAIYTIAGAAHNANLGLDFTFGLATSAEMTHKLKIDNAGHFLLVDGSGNRLRIDGVP